MSLSTELFDYPLPPHLIAQTPAARRDESRLLVVDRTSRKIEHRQFRDIRDYLGATDLLFRNNASVLPARLLATRPTGGSVECFLLRPAPEHGSGDWWCLVRPGKKLPVGATFARAGEFEARIEERDSEGGARVRFSCTGQESMVAVANRIGEVPLPPYIARGLGEDTRAADLERYQTVYADRSRQVAVAAPTAGLHFTEPLLEELRAKGVTAREVCLHVGLGTFRPISTETIETHPIHRELYELPPDTQADVLAPAGRRRIAIGTTTVRALEDFVRKIRNLDHAGLPRVPASPSSLPVDAGVGSRHSDHRNSDVSLGKDAGDLPAVEGDANSRRRPWIDEAGIYLYPPCHYNAVDALVTNFHQPRSTLLCLVSSFLTPGSTDGIAWLKEIYAEAVKREYRFFSYGDAMLIV